jgi:hypothetical protein
LNVAVSETLFDLLHPAIGREQSVCPTPLHSERGRRVFQIDIADQEFIVRQPRCRFSCYVEIRPRPHDNPAMTTDDLPPWLSTKEAALKVALWLSCQPDPPLHTMRVLCELAELSPCLRAGLLNPPAYQRAITAP